MAFVVACGGADDHEPQTLSKAVLIDFIQRESNRRYAITVNPSDVTAGSDGADGYVVTGLLTAQTAGAQPVQFTCKVDPSGHVDDARVNP